MASRLGLRSGFGRRPEALEKMCQATEKSRNGQFAAAGVFFPPRQFGKRFHAQLGDESIRRPETSLGGRKVQCQQSMANVWGLGVP